MRWLRVVHWSSVVFGFLLWSWSWLCRLSLSKSQMFFLVMSGGFVVSGSCVVHGGFVVSGSCVMHGGFVVSGSCVMHGSFVVNRGWLMYRSSFMGSFMVNWSLVHWSSVVHGCMHRSSMVRRFMVDWSGMVRRFVMNWSGMMRRVVVDWSGMVRRFMMDWSSVRGFVVGGSLMVYGGGCMMSRRFVMRSLVVLHWRLLLLM